VVPDQRFQFRRLTASRDLLVRAYAASLETSSPLAPLAALLHRLRPGLRLM
jgi:hypothetical protein